MEQKDIRQCVNCARAKKKNQKYRTKGKVSEAIL